MQALIAARLDTLPPERKALLQDAAVIGKVFWSGRWPRWATGEAAEVDAVLHELGRGELVRRGPTSRWRARPSTRSGTRWCATWCYGQIPRLARVERHVTAAAGSSRRPATGRGPRRGPRGPLRRGPRPRGRHRSVGGNRRSCRRRTRRYLTLAGDRSLGLDVVGAEALYRSALELTPEGTPERAHLLAKLAEALLQRARFSEANEMLEAAHALYPAVGDVRGGAVALARTSVILARMGDTRARGRTAAALELLEPLLPGPELVQVLSEYAGEAFISDDLDRTIEASKRAIEVAETLGMPTPARALGFLGGARSLADPAGIDDLRQAIAISDEQGLGREGCADPEQHRELDPRRWRAPARGSKHGVTRSSSPAAAAARSS